VGKFKFIAAVICLAAAAAAAAPMAGTREEVTLRLERAIDRASEQGNYRHVQTLRLELAEHLSSMGSYAAAARQYELLLASRPSRRDRVRYFIELGKLRDLGRDYGGAIQSFQDALHDDPKSWDANLNLARAYDHAELNSKAIEVYKQCIKLRPDSSEPYHGIARVYQQLGFLNKAVLNYQKALSIERRPDTYLDLADTYARQGNITAAKDILQQAKAVLPTADYDVRLGEIYSHQGDMKSACQAWEEALKVNEKRDDVRLHLALTYDHLGRGGDSDRMFKRLMMDYPRSPLVHFSRAWVLYARGDRVGAQQEALTARDLGPTGTVSHFTEELLSQLGKGKSG